MLFDIPALLPGVLAGLFLLAALLQGFGVRRRWRARRRLSALHRSTWLLVWIALASMAACLSASLSSYQRLIAEAPVATLTAREIGPRQFALRVDLADGSHNSVQVAGDEWQLDARVIKWTPRAVVLGAQPLYRVERISGRYRDIREAQTLAPSVAALGGDSFIDLWEIKHRFPAWLPFMDADYGSAAYLPLIDGGNYQVSLAAAGGLVARPADTTTTEKIKAKGW
ncbi:MAG: hypothetical protein ABI411_03495 [Tahibacter sp.]